MRKSIEQVKEKKKIKKEMKMVDEEKMRSEKEDEEDDRNYQKRMGEVIENIEKNVRGEDEKEMMVGKGKEEVNMIVV